MTADEVVLLEEWPQPAAGAPEPRIIANESSLLLRYMTHEGRVVIAYFPLVSSVQFGAPNDEALGGHPLSGRGLKHYSVHKIRDSSRIQALERQNAVHPQHDKVRYLAGRKHYIFTFHDSTLEVVALEDHGRVPAVKIFDDYAAADSHWRSQVDA